MSKKSNITIQLNDVLYSVVVPVNKALQGIVDKTLISSRCTDSYNETYDLVIICDYNMMVEVIRRIQIICDSPCDFVEIVIK